MTDNQKQMFRLIPYIKYKIGIIESTREITKGIEKVKNGIPSFAFKGIPEEIKNKFAELNTEK